MVAQNQGLEQVVDEAYSIIAELVMPVALPTIKKIHQLAARVRRIQEDVVKVYLKLNLQTMEL